MRCQQRASSTRNSVEDLRKDVTRCGMPADCEVSTCGVLAVGRCGRCGSAFCSSHRAFDPHGVPFVDLCAPCRTKEVQAEIRKWEEIRNRQNEKRIKAKEAVPLLARSIAFQLSQSQLGSRVHFREVRGLFFRQIKPVGFCWMLATVHWKERSGHPKDEGADSDYSSRLVLMPSGDLRRSHEVGGKLYVSDEPVSTRIMEAPGNWEAIHETLSSLATKHGVRGMPDVDQSSGIDSEA